jgi:beta-lactamase class A
VGAANPYDNAAAVSAAAFPGGASVAYIVAVTAYADGSSAAAAAAAHDGPLLLTAPTVLPVAIEAELRRLDPDRIVIVGGGLAAGVVTSLRSITPNVVSYGGADRYAVSRAVADGEFDQSGVVYVTADSPTTISIPASAAAGAADAPLILVNGRASTIDAPTRAILDSLRSTRIVIIGSTANVTSGIESALRATGRTVSRVGGTDGYTTSALTAAHAHPSASRAMLVSSVVPSHGVVAAAWAGAAGVPLLISSPICVPEVIAAELARLGASSRTLVGGAVNLNEAVAAGRTCGAERSRLEQSLTTRLGQVIAGYAGTYAVTVRQLDGLGQTISVRGGSTYEPASTIKILNAYAVLKRVQAGSLSLATKLSSGLTVRACLRAMIFVSDNPCHSDLIRKIGAQTLSSQFYREGYRGTWYSGTTTGGVKHGTKRSTTNDLSLMLYRLERGQLLNAEYSNYLRYLLHGQIWRSRIASGIQSGVWQGSKPGELWLSSGWSQSDTAIVRGPTSRYVIAVLGTNGASKAAIRAISRAAYEHFNGPIAEVASYPAQQMETTATVSLRAGPGTSQRVLATISKGRAVEVISSSRTWYRVEVGTKTGWIRNDYLQNRAAYR